MSPLVRGLGVPVHVGIATSDLDLGMDSVGRLFDVSWGTPRSIRRPMWTPDGVRDVALRRVHSRGDTMILELLEGGVDTLWATTSTAELHHYAFGTSDLSASVEGLRAAGWLLELTLDEGDGPSVFAYLRRPGEPRIELIEYFVK